MDIIEIGDLAYKEGRMSVREEETGHIITKMTEKQMQMPKWSTVKDFLECPLCTKMFKNPHKVQCGHRFCEICIYSLLRNKGRLCPLDGKRITPENAVLDVELQKKLEFVVADCPFAKNGCDWNGNAASVEEHNRNCVFADVHCPKGCGKKLLKKDVTAHVKSYCSLKFVRCKKCYIEMTVDQLQVHECPCDRYTCPEECGKTNMSLQELRAHQDPKNGQCSSAKIGCRFRDAGCTFIGTKKEMALHMKERSEDHVKVLCESLSLMTSKQEETQERLEKQADQLKTIQETFCQYAILLKEFETKQQKLLDQVAEQQRQITDQAAHLAAKDALVDELQAQLNECHDSIDELKYGSQNGTLLWKVGSFRECLNKALSQKKLSIYSPVILTSKFGYKLCVQLFPAGSGDSSGRFMSIYFHLLRTDHDDVLRWPFSNKISFTLIDQAESPDEAKNVSYTIIPAPNSISYQKPNQKMSEGRGCHQFVSLQELESRSYIKNDSIFIKIKVLQRT